MSDLESFQANNELYECMVSAIIKEIPSADIFVDAGAHVGRHTETMLLRQDVTTVFAVEAIPELAKIISGKSWADIRLQLHNCAVGMTEGNANFFVASNAMGYSGLAQRDEIPDIEWIKIETPMTTLDKLVPSELQSRVGLIKLDLEGGEFDAIRGSINIISNSRPFLIFENSLQEAADQYNYSKTHFFDFFGAHDYVVGDFFGNTVTPDYWDDILQTYMFVAYVPGTRIEQWWNEQRSSLIRKLYEQYA